MSDVNASALDHAAQTAARDAKPLDHDVWRAARKAGREAARKAGRDEQKAQPGALADCLMLAAWVLAIALVLRGVVAWASWANRYDASAAQLTVVIGAAISGLIFALLLGAAGRIVALLEIIAAKKS
jgi:hypothetical protein